jgi:hypothetical protein
MRLRIPIGKIIKVVTVIYPIIKAIKNKKTITINLNKPLNYEKITVKEKSMGNLLKTKTFWAGIALIATGIQQWLSGDQHTGLQSVLAGFGLIFLRDAVRK